MPMCCHSPRSFGPHAGKMGFSPLSLLELLQRRGRYHPRDFERLDLASPVDLLAAKQQWLSMLAEADAFVRARPVDELGCLYWDVGRHAFVLPPLHAAVSDSGALVPHFG